MTTDCANVCCKRMSLRQQQSAGGKLLCARHQKTGMKTVAERAEERGLSQWLGGRWPSRRVNSWVRRSAEG